MASSTSVPPGVEELFATVDGCRVRYLRSGSGPALVLLHGLLGYSFSWRFTIPALAQVGLTEAAARERGGSVAVGRAPFVDSTAAAVRLETEGLVKLVFDETSGRLLGAHVLGPSAEDLIHVAAVAMRAGLTRDGLTGMHYVYPTLAGSVFDAAWP